MSKIKMSLISLMAAIPLMSFGAKASADNSDPEVVATVDLARYVGFWHEIAHAPTFFQNGCVRSTAEYEILNSNSVSVFNTCYKADSSTSTIKGVAKVVDPAVPAKLKVKFNIFAQGDYWIVDLDENYQWAVVSAAGKKSLFILARQAPMSQDLLNQILAKLQQKGFDISNLIYDQYN